MLTTELMNKIRHIEIRTRRLVNDSFAGEYHSIFKGRGMEFNEVRPYLPGDEIRTIDWNVTARTGQPHVKQFVEERELTVMLVVDASGSGDFASEGQFKRELAAELASVLSFAATTNKDKVGLLIFTDQVELFIPPRKGRRHVLRLIRELLAFEPQGDGTDIKLALDTINQILKRRSILFLVSDFLDDPERYQQVLHRTNRKHDVIAIDLHDPLERDIANVGLLTLEDAETGELIWVDTADREWRTLFHNQVDQFETRKNKAFANAAVDQVSIHTDQDYFKALTLFFEKRAKRIRY
ncbi:MAG: DUF58 domain-containing protein [Anaerolineae bacterium]|nr:DUF58 domain-containing protein [Anaerolineae bacterium]